jgi:xylose isomerase
LYAVQPVERRGLKGWQRDDKRKRRAGERNSAVLAYCYTNARANRNANAKANAKAYAYHTAQVANRTDIQRERQQEDTFLYRK